MTSKSDYHRPACIAAHNLINKLSNIIGYCDLLIEKIEPGTDHARRLSVIREIADTAVKELVEHQRQAEAEMEQDKERKAG
jgi:hypothetical protein